ncbi:hypothetical protein LX77_00016 [Gelidibacter algens]|jgi:hypothetical protein|uniref:Uncharacterized protein n=1 Tax=Gelidibacter algens TaxID=49280 RepID=A0A327SHL7_9FLAO|nr:hypothetical protein [Gelidibacter algens]RAJ27444.1 hypothetical protein LX77_00016 [Gelidibacter algens]
MSNWQNSLQWQTLSSDMEIMAYRKQERFTSANLGNFVGGYLLIYV